ncbi:MAG: helix-turn-helix domain-containing protein [Candidatus Eremiobacterota bacterium]
MRLGYIKLQAPGGVARRLKVKKRTVLEWLRRDKLKGLKLGRLWRIRMRDLEAFLQRIEEGLEEA